MNVKTTQPVTVAIIGGGPRGLSVAERMGMELGKMRERTIRVLLIDDIEPGAGRIWNTAQSPELLMNTPAGQVTLFSGPRDKGPVRPGHGPSLHEWLRDHTNPPCANSGPNTYAPRRVFGEYQRYVLNALISKFPQPHTIDALHARVIDVEPRTDHFVLEFEGQRLRIAVSILVLATGHSRRRASEEEALWVKFSQGSRRCRYYAGDSAADLPIEDIRPGEKVGVIGLGLGFYDLLSLLTKGRGGCFSDTGERLTYLPSGREPNIVAGSRSGLPIPPRGVNQKTEGYCRVPVFFSPAAVEAARRNARTTGGRGALSFRESLYPLIFAELEHVYYGAWVSRLHGRETALVFARNHAEERNPYTPIPDTLLEKYWLEGVPRLDLEALARPFARMQFAGPAEFRRALRDYLVQDLEQACLGNLESPLKAALDVLRDVRDTLRSAVEFDGLTAASLEGEFKRWFAPLHSLLVAGPPVIRVNQLLAIEEAKVLNILGPGVTVHIDRQRDCFRLSSGVPGQDEPVTVLIDSRVPFPSLLQSQNPLLQAMERRGLLRPYGCRLTEGEISKGGGVDVLPPCFRVVGRDGIANPFIFAIGVPCESPRWFTQVGSGTPGVESRFTLDAKAVGRGVLDALYRVPAGTEEAMR